MTRTYSIRYCEESLARASEKVRVSAMRDL